MSPNSTQFAAEVVIPGLNSSLFYSFNNLATEISIGSEVDVELGRRNAKGWVVGFSEISALKDKLPKKKKSPQGNLFDEESNNFLKPILSCSLAFSEDQIKLFNWMSEYYGARLCDVIDNAIPKSVPDKQIEMARLSSFAKECLEQEPDLDQHFKRAHTQKEVVDKLLSAGGNLNTQYLKTDDKSLRPAVNALVKKNWLELEKTDEPLEEFFYESKSEDLLPTLTEDQLKATKDLKAKVNSKNFSTTLLFGVTGSGKTEVYLRAIDETLKMGGSALVVVPEIALTPQLVDRFSERLNTPLAVLHSQVGSRQRWESWRSLLDGRARVAIGARSAIFAPLQNLSLIIVDEEHESSYKQSDGFRYHGRDVAVMRAHFANCPIVLGSATPSFESLQNVRNKRYELLEMPKRVSSRPMPSIELVDLRKVKKKDMPSENISPNLKTAISEALSAKEQVIIMYNRRGFSSYLQCETCQEVVSCPDCSVALTFHKKSNHLVCHFCDFKTKPPSVCPICVDPKTTRIEEDADENEIGKLVYRGAGTEKVVEELAELFPEARISRMDRDTTTGKGAYKEILDRVRKGETDILVGTQMLAKGHDLPGVTLVGIVDADVGLHLPDFRSSEKVFQLITQAAGRAGRGEKPGKVVVQTRQPNHPTIVAASGGRFKAFARYELEQRAALKYPPEANLLRLIISAETFDDAFRVSRELKDITVNLLKENTSEQEWYSVLGPSPASYEKLRKWYRWNILVKASSKKTLSMIANTLCDWKGKNSPKGTRLAIDVDPVDML